MKTNNRAILIILFCIASIPAYTQNDQPPALNMGDPAPSLQVSAWLKGTPVLQFEKGRVYVVEFWATWCKPCKAAMPHLSNLAREYRNSVSFIGIDIYENKTTTLKKVKAFVDSMDKQMDYLVAVDDSNKMMAGWLEAFDEKDNGIPRTFVVNAEGKLAWIGHPKDLPKVLPKIVINTWDIKEALATRNLNRRLAYLDREASYDLSIFLPDPLKPNDPGQPDSALLIIKEIVRKEPKLEYAPLIAAYTFSSLLKTNFRKAYRYGKILMVTATYDEPAYGSIYYEIGLDSNKLKLPAEIYGLGAEAYQAEIDHLTYPEIANTPKLYHKMSVFYWHANDLSKAIEAEQKAIDILKSKKDFSKTDLAVYKRQLQKYTKR